MKRPFIIIASLFLLVAGSVTAQSPGATPPAATPTPADEAKKLAAMPVEDLISKLQEESKAGLGTDPMARCDPGDAKFQGGEFGSKDQKVSPVMHELITRGIHALPALIDHITDPRPTKATVYESLADDEKLENGKYGKLADEKVEIWLASDYSARDRRPSKEREGISTDPYSIDTYKQVHEYTLKVGDFCYVAVGQIVNRDLHALRYMAPLHVVVNTPVEVPVLATAVKADWGGLTPEEHVKSLQDDALRLTDEEALKRLSLYYPKGFDSPAIQLLNRPLYTVGPVGDFTGKLIGEKDKEKRSTMLAAFKKENGEAACLGVLKELIWMSTWQVTMEKTDPRKLAANQILIDSFPDVEPYNPPFINAASSGEQQTLIENLSSIPSSGVDEAVAGLLKRAQEMPIVTSDGDSIGVPGLVHACAQRLAGKTDYESLVRASLKETIEKLQKAWDPMFGGSMGFSGMNYIKILQDTLDKLPNGSPPKSPAG